MPRCSVGGPCGTARLGWAGRGARIRCCVMSTCLALLEGHVVGQGRTVLRDQWVLAVRRNVRLGCRETRVGQ